MTARALLQGTVVTLLVVGYPVIVYLLASHGFPWLGTSIVLGVLIWRLRTHPQRVWLIAAMIAIAVGISLLFDPATFAKLVPVAIHVTLFTVFWRSLDNVPIIERFARLDFPELPPEIERYVRQLTKVWTAFFGINAVLCLVLALLPRDDIWATYNGLVIYLMIGVLFVGEFIWRKIRFPGLQTPPFKESLARMIKYGRDVHDWKQQNN
ncbi:MAG: hypothetical protein KDJ24_13930 [Gammaproteobacteria bacterium]|nr:hypothetical protein [Gammaproteobacteria bacterium]